MRILAGAAPTKKHNFFLAKIANFEKFSQINEF
jgi:hypothetical protein